MVIQKKKTIKKQNKRLSYIFYIIFAIFFGINLILTAGVYVIRYPLCIPAALLMGAAVLRMLQYFLQDKHTKTGQFICILFLVMIALQLWFGWLLRITPGNDRNVIFRQAIEMAESGILKTSQEWNYYFLRYPNNRVLLLLEAGWFSLVKQFGVTNYLMANIVLNIAMIDLSLFFLLRLVKKVWNQRVELYCMILVFLFVPLYLYGPFVYTDSLTLPIVAGAVLLYYKLMVEGKGFFHKSPIRGNMGFLLLGAVIWLGYSLKATIAILLVAFCIHIVCIRRRRGMKACILMICIFAVLQIGTGAIIKQAQIVDETDYDTENFPYTHWIMMGLKGVGNYDKVEREFTSSFASREEKKQANLQVIKERLQDYGKNGLILHQLGKSAYTWSNGMYDMEFYLNKEPIQDNSLQQWVFSTGKYIKILKIYTEGYHLIMQASILALLINGIKKRQMDFFAVIALCVFGLCLFLMIWETRPRYLMHFVPLFLFLSIQGQKVLLDSIKTLPKRNTTHKKKK